MLVQNFGGRWQGAVRYDEYDRNSDVDGDEFTRWNFGVNWFYDGNTRFTLAYDIPEVSSTAGVAVPNTEDNLLTFQAQRRFGGREPSHIDQAVLFEHPQSLAHRATADAKLLADLFLGEAMRRLDRAL